MAGEGPRFSVRPGTPLLAVPGAPLPDVAGGRTIFWRFRGVDLSPIRSLCEGEGRVYYLAGRYLYALDLKADAR